MLFIWQACVELPNIGSADALRRKPSNMWSWCYYVEFCFSNVYLYVWYDKFHILLVKPSWNKGQSLDFEQWCPPSLASSLPVRPTMGRGPAGTWPRPSPPWPGPWTGGATHRGSQQPLLWVPSSLGLCWRGEGVPWDRGPRSLPEVPAQSLHHVHPSLGRCVGPSLTCGDDLLLRTCGFGFGFTAV